MKTSNIKNRKRANRIIIPILLIAVLIIGCILISYLPIDYIFSLTRPSSSLQTNMNLINSLFNGCTAYMKITGELNTHDADMLLTGYSPGSRTIADKIDELNNNANVKGLFIEIDSGGGSVIATKEIYNALEKFNKPIIVYINDIGASGGYYISLPADVIIANPDSTVGNIGVRATFISMRGLLDKIGISTVTLKTGKFKDIGDPFKNMTPEEKAVVSTMLNETYNEFLNDLLKHRHIKDINISTLTDGRIFSGRQAMRYGLVDKIGYFNDAKEIAKNITGTDKICKVRFKHETNIWNDLFSSSFYYIGYGLGDSLKNNINSLNNGGWSGNYKIKYN
ncbi:signal peptide peptidase SppA [Candidatus Micrarchaeota archaeon]|nr:signal peptide peptidase SppA [Candidatus Micrarchaeota archaeon]